jgi:hypothetical protein
MRPVILTFFFLLSLTAAHARQYKSKGAKPDQIDSLYYFEPVGSVGMIATRNDLMKSDSLSAKNIQVQKNLLQHYTEKLRLTGQIQVHDTLLQKRIKNELLELMTNAARKKYFEELGHSSVIDSVMDAGKKRFALILFNQGFVRTRENKRWQQRQANTVGAFGLLGALGTLAFAKDAFAVPLISTSSDLYIMIIDAQENKTFYFGSAFSHAGFDYNPIDVNELNEQFITLFEGFYFPRSNNQRI